MCPRRSLLLRTYCSRSVGWRGVRCQLWDQAVRQPIDACGRSQEVCELHMQATNVTDMTCKVLHLGITCADAVTRGGRPLSISIDN